MIAPQRGAAAVSGIHHFTSTLAIAAGHETSPSLPTIFGLPCSGAGALVDIARQFKA
jgi:hypothetical protein